MIHHGKECLDVCIAVGRRVSMNFAPKLFSAKAGFIDRAGSRAKEIFFQRPKDTEHGKSLQCQNHLRSRFLLNVMNRERVVL